MTLRRPGLTLALLGLLTAAPAVAVGLAPLHKEGLTGGPAKAF